MDVRPDTSSSRSQDGWSFLHHGITPLPDAQRARSLRSNVSPVFFSSPHNISLNGSRSRSSFSRNLASASTGARSTTTIPSNPVVVRINSEFANNHNCPMPRLPRPDKIDEETGLPALSEFSLRGVMDAIQEAVEPDINTIAEVLGRSRLVLADHYEAQMPPQGEITMASPLQGIEEGTNGVEQLGVGDNVMILREDASLVEGSNSGSAAYGLLERLQAVPRTTRMHSDAALLTRSGRPEASVRNNSSPAGIPLHPEPESPPPVAPTIVSVFHEPTTVPSDRGPSRPVVSETYLSAEANGVSSGIIPIVSEAGRHYPLYAHDETGLFETSAFTRPSPTRRRRFNGFIVPDLFSVSSWFSRGNSSADQDAEARLRDLLNR